MVRRTSVCIDDKTGTALGSRGPILRTTTGGSTWAKQKPPLARDLPTETSLRRIPEPFNPETKTGSRFMS